MLIDALRVDYVFNKTNSYYLKSIKKFEDKGKALSIKLRTHTPTVTLPRLKVRRLSLIIMNRNEFCSGIINGYNSFILGCFI